MVKYYDEKIKLFTPKILVSEHRKYFYKFQIK